MNFSPCFAFLFNYLKFTYFFHNELYLHKVQSKGDTSIFCISSILTIATFELFI